MSKPDNPSAFPVPDDAADMPGMSLRDWYAGQALAGLLARGAGGADTAPLAYVYADQMLAEREKVKP